MKMKWEKKGFFRPTYFLKSGDQVVFMLESTGDFLSPNPPWKMSNASVALAMGSGFSFGARRIFDARSNETVAEITCELSELMALRKDRRGSIGKVATKGGEDFQLELAARPHEGIKITARSGTKALQVELRRKDVTLITEMDLRDRYAAAVCLGVSSWFLCSREAIRQFVY